MPQFRDMPRLSITFNISSLSDFLFYNILLFNQLTAIRKPGFPLAHTLHFN